MRLKEGTIQHFLKGYITVSALSHIKRFHGVVVITPDFESGNLGSNPGGTYINFVGKKQTIGDEHPKVSKLWETATRFLFFL
jgi:hypothetical protein